MPTWFVTGTSRGIGLEIARQIAASSDNLLIASCRNPENATALQTIKSEGKAKTHIIKLDVSDDASIQTACKQVQDILSDRALDYLINNAAVTEGSGPVSTMKVEALMDSFKANVAGPAVITQSLLPLIEKSHRKVVMHLTTGLSSFGRDFGAKNASYTISKTALNMLMYKQATERTDLVFFVVDPGWVKTDMGGAGALLEPHESVSGLLSLITTAKSEHSGKFFNYKGEVQPW